MHLPSILSIALALSTTALAKSCSLTGSDTIVARSCPSRACDDMKHMAPGGTCNVDCYCEGEVVGGDPYWLHMSSGCSSGNCWVRAARTGCCGTCVPMCSHCPCAHAGC
uniref:Uncharacterized protein n=1 Tax=Lindgomyces ingoldianus TaxID=673940 RepID=A0ACB6QRL1_9PLEO|nr:uncharacterized protein BDR25DRAFT_372556 [Lindgomyces ingoldianus]KAF2468725.1 hypothetical protein BDR25DRAFT_372556 [Lindgomyces ingoldianus]